MMQQFKQKYSYEEPKDALNSRISAHTKYSDFNLHEWIKKKFQIESGDTILDLGCGNGNYTKIFWEFVRPNGRIIGLDKNENLINEAKANHGDLPKSHVNFLVHNYDDPFPKLDTQFNWIFAIYSLYYTEESLSVVEVLKGQLKKYGRFVVIGPGPENARDMAKFNYELTGVKPNKEFFERIERIDREFKPLFDKVFAKTGVHYETVDSVMNFPTVESCADYYYSTMLWRESIAGRSEREVENIRRNVITKLSQSLPVKFQKQMSCLIGEVK